MRMRSYKDGVALLLVLGLLSVMMIGSAAVFAYLNNTMSRSHAIENRQVCLNLAEAGVQKAIAELSAKGVAYTGEQQTPLGDGDFSVSVDAGTERDAYTITATGFRRNGDVVISKATVIANVTIARSEWRVTQWTEVRGW